MEFDLVVIPLYVGPGSGLGSVGALAALAGAVALMVVGFIWYPVKRLMKRKKDKQAEREAGDQT